MFSWTPCIIIRVDPIQARIRPISKGGAHYFARVSAPKKCWAPPGRPSGPPL